MLCCYGVTTTAAAREKRYAGYGVSDRLTNGGGHTKEEGENAAAINRASLRFT